MIARTRSAFLIAALAFGLAPLAVRADDPKAPAKPDEAAAARAADRAAKEGRYLKNVRQLTKGTKPGEKSGEAYFSPDGKQIIFQSVRDGMPYYQIFVIPAEGGDARLLSTGKGKTTCAYFHPTDPDRFLYASSHLDERTHAAPPPEDPKKRSYKWDYDGSFDVFEGSLKTGTITRRLTDAAGYDAEASYSHDGKKICFTSGRDGPNAIYVMDADGKNAVRIGPPAPAAGAKALEGGGPFFMPGDQAVIYRAQAAGDPMAPMQALVTSVDGKETKTLTRAPRMNWCPYPHPDGKKAVYAAPVEGHNFELFLVKTDGSFREVRLTWNDASDVLPTFSPDGKRLVWTAKRGGGDSEVFVADFVDPPEDAYSVQSAEPEAAPAHGPGARGGDKPADPHAAPRGDKPADPHAAPRGDKPLDPHAANPHGDPRASDPKTSGVVRGSESAAKNPPAPILGADHLEELGLIEDVRWLADPARAGRRAGTAFEQETARWVASRFAALGVAPGGLDGSYEQPFPILAGAKLELEKCSFGLEEHARGFAVEKDFRPLLYSGNGTLSAPLVFCGYGIEDKDHEYDDYLSVDLAGKIAVVYTRGPRSEGGGAFGANHATMVEDLRYKVATARHHGAVGVVFLRAEGKGWLELGYGDPGIPVVQLSNETFLPLFQHMGLDLEAERKKIDETLKPRSQAIVRTVGDAKVAVAARVAVQVAKVTATSRNVIGRIEGTAPGRDVIVVGAHMDHLGFGGDGSLAPGVEAIHPGADDNASGVAGVLAIARALKAAPLRHSVVFVTFGGEEMGLLGSAHLVKSSPIKLERVEAMLNMDMIGRLGKEPLVVGGAGTAKEWPEVINAAAHSAAIDVAPSKDGFGPSDHASFYGKGIPVLFLFTRSHADYHRPSDTAEKIDAAGLERVARFGLAALRAIDALPGRPTYEKAGADPHAQGAVVTGEKGVYFGSVPDYGDGEESQDGVKISGARPGSPADKAGLRAGDKIVEFDGRAIKNLYDYTFAIRGGKAGKKVKVVVIRDGKRLELEAQLVER